MRFWGVKNENFEQLINLTKKLISCVLYVFPERNPGWRFTARLSHKNAESASRFRSARATKRKIYKKMYNVVEVIFENSIANYRKAASYYNKASMKDIQK